MLETGIDTFFYLDPECRTEILTVGSAGCMAPVTKTDFPKVHKACFARIMQNWVVP